MECIERNLITRVLTIFNVKLTQSTSLEQKRFDLRSLSAALRNLWLFLVFAIINTESRIGVVVSVGFLYVILLHEKLLQFDWLRAVVFQLNLKYLHVKITNFLRVVV